MAHNDAAALPQRMTQDDDRFILRGLIWCAVCDQAMTPTTDAAGIRQYRCPDPDCPRRLVLAEMAERLAWDHFAHLNEANATAISPEERREALRPVLARVWVGRTVYDQYYEWHD
jgi:Recombinase zinc beta ribbon domain